MEKLFLILGNQLFHPKHLIELGCSDVLMLEDYGLCTYEKHHKLKIYLFLCAMREYRDELENHGIKVHYSTLEDRKKDENYITYLKNFHDKSNFQTINFFQIEDKVFEEIIINGLEESSIHYEIHSSPMFMFSRDEFRDLNKNSKVFRLASFYQYGRKKFKILMDDNDKPIGGKWSFDAENRKKIPPNVSIPKNPSFQKSKYHKDIVELIENHFPNHPGILDEIWFPVNRNDAEVFLNIFLNDRLENFGIYEDAMLEGKNFLFHSCLSSSLNIGLITPSYLITKLIEYSKTNNTPLNSLEGFIRQILGWREFIRGIYQEKGEFQTKRNYWGHKKKLSDSWYNGTTGIIPLDDSINTALNHGYNHHIPRLMVISNIMNLCEIDPLEIYKWFMEMYIDSSEWVMVPNVFGMATYSDGGLMSTKPYTCGSNYILKMSNYKKGDWCDIVDGLYWRFTEKNIDFYKSNPRLSFLHRTLDRMSEDRKSYIFKRAEDFISQNTK